MVACSECRTRTRVPETRVSLLKPEPGFFLGKPGSAITSLLLSKIGRKAQKMELKKGDIVKVYSILYRNAPEQGCNHLIMSLQFVCALCNNIHPTDANPDAFLVADEETVTCGDP